METKKNFVINAAFYGILILVIIAVYRYILPILLPFIIGFCVAAIVQLPLRSDKLKNMKHRRLLAAGLVIVFYGIVVGLLVLFGFALVREAGNLVHALPGVFNNHLYPFFSDIAHRVEEILEPIDPRLADWVMDIGHNAADNMGKFATDLSAGAVKLVATGAVSIPGVLIQIILTVVSSFYMAGDYQLVVGFIKSLIPKSSRGFAIDIIRYAKSAVVAFLKSYSIIFLVTFLELWVGLSILKVPYSLAIGFGIALFDLMPVLGTGGILLPWVVIALALGSYGMAIGVAVLYLVITAVRQTLEPRIVGNRIGLHPLATLVAMILGLNLMGLLGMLLLPITLVALNNIRKETQKDAV